MEESAREFDEIYKDFGNESPDEDIESTTISAEEFHKTWHRILDKTYCELYGDLTAASMDRFRNIIATDMETHYLDNHPNKRIALAMEVIIQVANLYEEGVYEISPRMYGRLEKAVSILGKYSTQDNVAESFHHKGVRYLSIFEPMQDA